MYKTVSNWVLLTLLISSSIISTFAYPNVHQMERGFAPIRGPQLPSETIARKFVEKPNSVKKVALDDLNDIETNEIQESGFTWTSLIGSLMHMIFSPAQQGPNKSDDLETTNTSPWANLISVGLKILKAFIGGGGGDGIDKVDNGSPMQFINIVVNLLDALKTSFSHRSLAARNIGRKDSISDATVAGIAMMKGYIRSMSTEKDSCMQKFMCDASNECVTDIGQSSLFCQLGSYATSFVLERSYKDHTFDMLYEASRRGRSGMNCQRAYLECNEV
ncbi:uncharacterized protein [Onthophagus taurus]|uniref:uncharacterized protein isoform X2 n=1 Tax=Onthophagus taurus TaxID=166361 RepID=UPI000C201736|nr:uncharacterized protein LOC111413974 isoform X2 [Onthophagus taurus]